MVVSAESARVCARFELDGPAVEIPWREVTADQLSGAAPFRTFRWRDGQRHYSGTYWSSTNSGHVIYESRLELSNLLLADFDPTVTQIVAQPFLLAATVDGQQRRHIPDFLYFTPRGPIVVDVKPAARLLRPKVTFTFDWTRQLVEMAGWEYRTLSEPDSAVLENVRFLSGYRRGWLLSSALVNELQAAALEGETLGRACATVPGWAPQIVRAALFHLIWRQHLHVDLTKPLQPSTVMTRSASHD